jgi:hypothetical protein
MDRCTVAEAARAAFQGLKPEQAFRLIKRTLHQKGISSKRHFIKKTWDEASPRPQRHRNCLPKKAFPGYPSPATRCAPGPSSSHNDEGTSCPCCEYRHFWLRLRRCVGRYPSRKHRVLLRRAQRMRPNLRQRQNHRRRSLQPDRKRQRPPRQAARNLP